MKTIAIAAAAFLLLAGVVLLSVLQDAKTIASGDYERDASPSVRTRELVVRPDRLRANMTITSTSIASAKTRAESVLKGFVAVEPKARIVFKDATVTNDGAVIHGDIEVPLRAEDDFWKRAVLLEALHDAGRKLEKKTKEPVEVTPFGPELSDVSAFKAQLIASWGAHVKAVATHAKIDSLCTPEDRLRETALSLEEIELALELHCPSN